MIEFIITTLIIFGPIVSMEIKNDDLRHKIDELTLVINENAFQAFHCQNNLNKCERELNDILDKNREID